MKGANFDRKTERTALKIDTNISNDQKQSQHSKINGLTITRESVFLNKENSYWVVSSGGFDLVSDSVTFMFRESRED